MVTKELVEPRQPTAIRSLRAKALNVKSHNVMPVQAAIIRYADSRLGVSVET